MTYRLGLFGAPPDTPNMGVSALFASVIEGLTDALREVEWIVFDNGFGSRHSDFIRPDGSKLRLRRYGARGGRRYYLPENLATMQFAAGFGGLAGVLHPAIKFIDSCDAILDISGGDSFSDIYGMNRFNAVYWPKKIALQRRKPLILMPQTYGPYRSDVALAHARQATRGATMAWARDPNSFGILQSLLGDGFDPERHRQGVDVAFGLEPRDALHKLPPQLAAWFAETPDGVPLVGINVSGLIYNDPERARSNYRFVADYRAVIQGLVSELIATTPARIVLLPHVMDLPGHYESDMQACLEVLACLGDAKAERVAVSPLELDQSEAKWMIARLDWFCGTRMHSTIAGLSSGVPTAAIAYSDKTLGVFDTCGQAEQVFDPRHIETKPMVAGLVASYARRDAIRHSLADNLPRVKKQAHDQMQVIADQIRLAAATAGHRP